MLRKKLGVLLLLVGLVLLVACSGGSDSSSTDNESSSGSTIAIQAAHVVSQDTTQQEMYEKFKELVEEKSDGRIVIDIYPDGQLGGEREMVENTRNTWRNLWRYLYTDRSSWCSCWV